jgi:N6-L-threonylcarbamoyladenine synthase
LSKLSSQDIADIAASFQAAVVDVLVAKTIQAVERTGVCNVVVGGGVAANQGLRTALTQACEKQGLTLYLTPMHYCTDNAAMIASLGTHMLKAGRRETLALEPKASY